MRKFRAIYILLFSFFVLSILGCKKAESPYPSLVAQKEWDRVQAVAKERFATSYSSEDLYYLGRASYESDEYDLALEAVELYFHITTEDAITPEARALALQLPHYSGRIEQGMALSERGMLSVELAGSYYQALLAEGQREEANRIFATYLIDTVSAFEYASLLAADGKSGEPLLAALEKLSEEERITILVNAPVEQYTPEVAVAVAGFIEGETTTLSPLLRYQRYESLWRLYSRAGMRVLANKYRSQSVQAAQGLDVDVSGD